MLSTVFVALLALTPALANPYVDYKHILTFSLPSFFSRLERRTATNVFPTPPTTSSLSAPITVKAGQTFTPASAYTRYDRGSGACNGQNEGGDSDAVFLLEEGATLSRVVIGPNQSEGVHCLGSCTLDHVFFEDVCEDAITIKQKSGTSRINYGGVSQLLSSRCLRCKPDE
jgi:pectate lyase